MVVSRGQAVVFEDGMTCPAGINRPAPQGSTALPRQSNSRHTKPTSGIAGIICTAMAHASAVRVIQALHPSGPANATGRILCQRTGDDLPLDHDAAPAFVPRPIVGLREGGHWIGSVMGPGALSPCM